ncbi:MAG: hypothetical protein FJ275_07530 [Planctomycetes bacterium]|nr:hypothetical protein [Planctomycetota bacterium]
MVSVQDLLAIAVAVAAGAWLARSLWRRLRTPNCGPADVPPGSDGFVPLEAVGRPRKKHRDDRQVAPIEGSVGQAPADHRER